jgi:tetratricopeptide (TPR) repeat protein
MNQEIAVGYLSLGDRARFRDFTRRTARFLLDLPYSEELRPAYDHVATMYAHDHKELGEAKRWLESLEEIAERYHDLRALGDVHFSAAGMLDQSGDAREAIARLQKALEIFRKIGDANREGGCLGRLGDISLSLGDLEGANEYARAEIEVAEKSKAQAAMAGGYLRLGRVQLCEGDRGKAAAAVQEAIRLFREAEDHRSEGGAIYCLGRVLVAQGDRAAAFEQYQEAIERVDLQVLSQDTLALANVLSAAQEDYQDASAFRALCARWRQAHPGLAESRLAQWYLEPAEVGDAALGQAPAYDDGFADVLGPDWTWVDPLDDCWFRVRQGLEIHAANRRRLWHINLSAPRVLCPALGDLAVQTVCGPISDEMAADVPACGGLLMWVDRENYVWLDVGTGGAREVMFGSCISNVDQVTGRGRLPLAASQDQVESCPCPALLCGEAHLRLERIGEQVRALCSVDGEDWFSIGEVTFPASDPLQVGLYANGNIDRLIYPAAYADGTAIRFGSFQILNLCPSSSMAK